jgi:hypothetical protein
MHNQYLTSQTISLRVVDNFSFVCLRLRFRFVSPPLSSSPTVPVLVNFVIDCDPIAVTRSSCNTLTLFISITTIFSRMLIRASIHETITACDKVNTPSHSMSTHTMQLCSTPPRGTKRFDMNDHLPSLLEPLLDQLDSLTVRELKVLLAERDLKTSG